MTTPTDSDYQPIPLTLALALYEGSALLAAWDDKLPQPTYANAIIYSDGVTASVDFIFDNPGDVEAWAAEFSGRGAGIEVDRIARDTNPSTSVSTSFISPFDRRITIKMLCVVRDREAVRCENPEHGPIGGRHTMRVSCTYAHLAPPE